MKRHLTLTFRPDLDDSLLEDRVLMAYSAGVPPVILTTSGFFVLATPPGLSSALNSIGGGGGPGASGGNIPTSFNIAGFGPTSITIGNVTGFPGFSAGGAGSNGQGISLITPVGSGANALGGNTPTPVSRNVVANGGLGSDPAGTDFLYIGREFGSGTVVNPQGTSPSGPGGSGASGTPNSPSNPPPPQNPPPPLNPGPPLSPDTGTISPATPTPGGVLIPPGL